MSASKITSYHSTQPSPATPEFHPTPSRNQSYVYSPDLYDRGPKGSPNANQRSYQELESGQAGDNYLFAMDDLDAMAGDLENLGENSQFESPGISEEHPATQASSTAELKEEKSNLRQSLDRLKTQIQNSSLVAETKNVFMEQANHLSREFKTPEVDLDSLRENIESLAESFEEASAEAVEKAKDLEFQREHFKAEVELVKMELKAKIDAAPKLDAATKASLAVRYQQKADALLQEKDPRVAAGKLDLLSRYLEIDIQTELAIAEAKAKAADTGGHVSGSSV